MSENKISISIVSPVHNEEKNLEELIAELVGTLENIGKPFEIILTDDGSTDGSFEIISSFSKRDPRIKGIKLARNFGQTAAFLAGFDAAAGDIIITMDADLQNDPADIPRLLEKLDEGYDVVSGWRKNRKDKLITRKIPSTLANRFVSWVGKVYLHDYGCSLKAYRSEIIKKVRIYGEMHRFIPIYCGWVGGAITEIEVNHRPRKAGSSKYNLSRAPKVLFDLMTMRFMGSYLGKPIYLFGGAGLIFMLVGFLSFLSGVYDYAALGIHSYQTNKILLTVIMFILGIQSIMTGLLAEIMVRTYFESQNKTSYIIKESVNLP